MGWIVAAAVIAALIVLLALPVRVRVKYGEQLLIRAWVLCFPYTIMNTARPKKAKKPKEARRVSEKPKKTKKTKPVAERPKRRLNIISALRLVRILLKKLIRWLGRRLRVNVKYLQLIVGTDDASKTAMLYAGICEAAGALMLTLRRAAHLKLGEIRTEPDFIGGKITIKVDVVVSFSPLSVLGLAFGAAMAAVKNWPMNKVETEPLKAK